MIKYEVVGISMHNGKEAGLLLANAMNGVTDHFSYGEIMEKIITGTIQVSGATLINNKVVVENRDMLKAFPVSETVGETAEGKNSKIFQTGDEILKSISKVRGYNKRYLFDNLVNWVDKEEEPRISALYGLRRTGKSVLLLQICEHYLKLGKKVAYAELSSHTNEDQLIDELDILADNNYDLIVIDEITFLEGFLGWGNRLSDRYARWGIKIIIAGTQSLMLEAAKGSILFDRMDKFNTTYISYQEFNSLYSGATVLDYIKWGGVLSKSRIVKNISSVGDINTDKIGVTVVEEPLGDYVNTAIIDNIEHTLESYSRANSRWRRVFEEHRAENLEGIIQLYVMSCSEKALMDDTGKEFIDKNLGSTLRILKKQLKLDPKIKRMISDYTREALNIPTNLGLDEDLVEDLNKLLKQLDLLEDAIEYRGKELKKHTFPIFVQPGLQYDQVMQAVNALELKKEEEKGLEEVEGKAKEIEVVEGEAELLKEKMMADIEGKLLEAVIRLNLIKLVKSKKNGKSIGVFSINPGDKEIDIVVRQGRDNITLIEVKRSEKIIPNQYRWLCDKEFNSVIEEKVGKIRRRIVIYMGDSKIHKVDGYELLYINAADWLLSTDITKGMMK